MPRLIDEALNALQHADPQTVNDGITLATSFFEHAHGQKQGLFRMDVLTQPATPADLVRLQQGLMTLIDSRRSVDLTTSAIWALGKCYQAELTPYFVNLLREYLSKDPGVLYQTMIALDNLDENVFDGRNSASLKEERENQVLAAAYLKRVDGAGE